MDTAIEQRDGQIVLLPCSSTFDELRGDARFDDLVRRVGVKA